MCLLMEVELIDGEIILESIWILQMNYDVWMISEYAAATNIWGTYVGHIRMEPYPGAHAFLQPLEY